jgi:hypothetical protein
METTIEQCECGKTWKLTKIKTIGGIRDIDSSHCTCGRKLIDWSGAHMWSKKEVKSKAEKSK